MNRLTVTKSLILCSFVTALSLSGCSGSTETNSAKTANANANKTNTAVVVSTIPTPTEDTATKAKIEEALKKAGFTDITVDATTTPITIRGTVSGDKLAEVVFVAEQAAGKKVQNDIKEKK